jgi:[protein-PII] uridylyltransferase
MEGRIFLRQLLSVQDLVILMDLFEFAARHGLKLSAETERCVEAAVPGFPLWAGQTPDLWTHFRRILVAPHAGLALRAMHQLGVLVAFFPEFHAIDALVIRDYYHRYTVDEHSLVALENVHALRRPQNDVERRFLDILDGIERPDLLFLALLFHDVGKGMTSADHVEGSVTSVRSIVQRLKFDAADCEAVLFLVANHLRMSATTMHRDIFDPNIVSEFSESIGAEQPLKMLTVLTYADIKSVSPDALTPWKAEMLWQLYAAAFNNLSRNVDDQRVRADLAHGARIQQIRAASNGSLDAARMTAFLAGLPRRYLLTYSAEQIVAHCRMHERLDELDPQIEIVQRDGYYELALLTLDCPFLFAGVTGTLSSWGMNILKADAYSNKAGTVLDTFRISDRFHTLDLNPGEVDRLKRSLADAVSGEVDVAELMRRNFKPTDNAPKIKVEPRLHVDNDSSQHSTLIEVTAQDRPGLLYDISAALSELGCNIQVAIIDTQGQTAIDVFYVTCAGTKLDSAHQRKLRAEIMQQL